MSEGSDLRCLPAEQANELLSDLNGLRAVFELHLNSADDREVFDLAAAVCSGFRYPDIFDRDLALRMLHNLDDATMARAGERLVSSWCDLYRGLGFVCRGDRELVAMYAVQEMETKLSARLLIDVRGSHWQKSRAAIALIRHWQQVYALWLRRLGYRYVTASALSHKHAALIRKITDHERRQGRRGFRATGQGEPRRLRGHVVWEKFYRFDLTDLEEPPPNGKKQRT